MWAEVCSKAEHTEGPWDTGVAAGGRYLSWGQFLGTKLCFLMPEPWCQGAFGILLHPSCGQQHCCPIPGRNNPQNTDLCFCKSLEGALTLECAHQVFKEAGDNTVSWRRTLCLCMNFTGLWLFVIKWDKQRFYGQRVVFCSSSATICSCG